MGHFAYLSNPEVSPRAMSENIALTWMSHRTAESTGVTRPY